MRKYLLSLAAVGIILCTSCAETPSEVKSEIDNYNDAETIQETALDTLPFSEMIDQAYKFNEKNNTNISVKELIVPQSTKMPTYHVDFYNDKVSEIFTKLQSEPMFENDGQGSVVETKNDLEVWMNNKDYCFTAFPELNGANYYRNASNVKISDWGTYYGQDMHMTEAGCITCFCDDSIGSYCNHSVNQRFYSNFNQNNEAYTLNDGTSKSVAETADFAEDFCNSNLKELENNLFDYQVNYMDVRDLGNEKFGYYVSLCRKDSYGNYFDATRIYNFGFDEFADRNALIASPMHLWITSSDNISEFEKNYTFSLEEIAENENFVTFECAVDTISKTLAQGKSYTFDTAELKYIFEITQSDYIDAARAYSMQDEFAENKFGICYSPESVYAYGDYEINAIPYWVFTNVLASDTDTNCGELYMINALDGSFRIENSNKSGNIQIPY